MQHREVLPFLVAQATENGRKMETAFSFSVSDEATDGFNQRLLGNRAIGRKDPPRTGNAMKWLTLSLAVLLALLQYVLWFGDGGLRDLWRLERQVTEQQSENERLTERNDALAAEVKDLKTGLEAVEARARLELGMIKEDEVFYQVIDSEVAPRKGAVRSGDEP